MAFTESTPGVELQSKGGRGREQVVCCKYCPNKLPISNGHGFKSPAVLQRLATREGWKWSSNGKHACPKCISKFKVKSSMKKSENTAPREMLREDKRNIFREIDANYDGTNQRYIDDATDQEIAKKLGVPRKWVSDVREADFGPVGRNEEMERVASLLGKLAHDAKQSADKALIAAEQAEKAKLECETLRKRLEAVEASVGPRRVA